MAFIPLKRIRFHYLWNKVNDSAYQRYLKEQSLPLHVRMYTYLLFMTYEKNYNWVFKTNEELAEKLGCYTRNYREKLILLSILKRKHENLLLENDPGKIQLNLESIRDLNDELKALEQLGKKYSIICINKAICLLEKEHLIKKRRVMNKIDLVKSKKVDLKGKYRGKVRFLKLNKKYAEKLMSIFQYSKSKINASLDMGTNVIKNVSVRLRKFIKYRIFSLATVKGERPGEFDYLVNQQRENKYMKNFIRPRGEPGLGAPPEVDEPKDELTENELIKVVCINNKINIKQVIQKPLNFIITDEYLPF